MHKNKKSIVKKKDFFVFIKGKPYFVIGVLVFLFFAIIFFVLSTPVSSQVLDKASYAKQVYSSDRVELDDYLQQINTRLGDLNQSALDMAYLESIRDDLLWLKDRQTELFYSKPSTDVHIKIITFSVFMQEIIQINDDFTVDFGEPDYQERISSALSTQINPNQLATDEELQDGLDTIQEMNSFRETEKKLFDSYISLKKSLAQSAPTIERRYVEAKKLTWLNYVDLNTQISE